MICPYSFDEPVGSGAPSLLDGRYWCMGWIALGMSARRHRCPEDCPVDFGPWGAWRAAVDNRMAVAFLFLWCATEVGDAWAALQYDRIIRCAVPKLLEPVGWSP